MENKVDMLAMLRYAKAPQCVINEVNMFLNIARKKAKEDEIESISHTIFFIPVCGKCGNPIADEINVEREGDCLIERVTPYFCKSCGTYFNSIVMPGRFPFKGYLPDND